MLIDHIDKIARDKKRAVLWIDCAHHSYQGGDKCDEYGLFDTKKREFVDSENQSDSIIKYKLCENFENYGPRIQFLKFLDDNGIKHEPAGPFASENGFSSWDGMTYIDVPFDEENEDYIKVQKYLENEDGTSKDPNLSFFYLPLERAMENAHHDEPGFWEKWAENF